MCVCVCVNHPGGWCCRGQMGLIHFITGGFAFIQDYRSCSQLEATLLCFLVSCSQTRQPVFVQLLQAVFRVYHCNWLIPVQKGFVESCIKVLSDVGKISVRPHTHTDFCKGPVSCLYMSLCVFPQLKAEP